MSDVRKLVFLSDLHLRPQPLADARCPNASLARILAEIRRDHGDAEAIFMLGDLADSGHVDEYRALNALLPKEGPPVHLTLGNHDSPDAFHQVFGSAQPLYRIVSLSDGTPCYILNTHRPGTSSGRLGEAQLAWLRQALQAATRPGFIMMHHPAASIAVPAFDAIGLEDRAAFLDVLSQTKNIRAVFFGHCHMQVSIHLGSVPAYCVPSSYRQSIPHFGETKFGSDHLLPSAFAVAFHAADAFAFHTVREQTLSANSAPVREPDHAVC